MLALVVIVALCYAGFAFFSIQSVLARVGAANVGANAAGAAFEKMMSTLKRLVMFVYPPFLGVMIYKEEFVAFVSSMFLSFILATLVSIVCLMFRKNIEMYFERAIVAFSSGVGPVRSMFLRQSMSALVLKRESRDDSGVLKRERMDWKIFVPAVLIHTVFAVAIFVLNTVAFYMIELGPIIFQLLGLFNAVGTLLLAFYLDPLVSRKLDKNAGLDVLSKSLVSAHLVSYLFLGPSVLLAVLLFLYGG